MPNTLTSIFVSNPATEPVEAPHPNTGFYVLGTQATVGGPWTVTHTLVNKTATPLTMVGRLKNFPAVTVSVVASGGPNAGNIFNNILAQPTGAAATGTNATTINVAVSSIANQTGYRLLASNASTGPFTQIYQGTTASFPHTGLTASQTQYYQWQYVGGGYYDDSPLSAVFQGTATAAAPVVLTPSGTSRWGNAGISRGALATGNLFAALSYDTINLNGSTSLTVSAISSFYAYNAAGATLVVIDGTTVLPTLQMSSAAQDFALTGLSGGTVKIIMGGQQRTNEAGAVLGTDVAKYTLPSASTAALVAPAVAATEVLTIGDSLSNGATTASPQQLKAWPYLLRKTGQNATAFGYGSAQGYLATDPANYPALKAAVTAAVTGATTAQVLVFTDMTNDFGGAGGGTATPTAFASRVAACFTSLRTDFPTLKIVAITAIPRTDEASANSLGFALPAYRTAAVQAWTGLAGVSVYNGPDAVSVADLGTTGDGDGVVHLSSAGQVKFAAFVQAAIAGTAVALNLNGGSQYAELANSGGAALTGLPGWGFGMVVNLSALTGIRALITKAQLGSGADLAQSTYLFNNAGTPGRLSGDWNSTSNGPTGGDSGQYFPANTTVFVGGSFGSGVPFLQIGTTVYPLTGTFAGTLANSTQPIRFGAAYNVTAGANVIGGFVAGSMAQLSVFKRALTTAELAYMAGTNAGAKAVGEIKSTGTVAFTDAACLLYTPALRTPGINSLNNLAVPANPLNLIGF